MRVVFRPVFCGKMLMVIGIIFSALFTVHWLIRYNYKQFVTISLPDTTETKKPRSQTTVQSVKPGVHNSKQTPARLFDQCVSRSKTLEGQKCPWPPRSAVDLVSPWTGRYELSLRPIVTVTEETGRLDKQLQSLAYLYGSEKNCNGSQLRCLVHRDAQARRLGEEYNFDLYPQIADTVQIVKSVRKGEPVVEVPINDVPLEVLVHPGEVCNENDSVLDLVVFVKTCCKCFHNRDVIRRTYAQRHLWKGFAVRFVFVVGTPEHNQPESYIFDGVKVPRTDPIPNSLSDVKNITQQLMNESFHYRDLLVGNFVDNYYNLSRKMMFTFRWASVFCSHHSPIYLFVDDDQTVIPSNVIHFIQQIPPEQKRSFSGGRLIRALPVRPTQNLQRVQLRWVVSENEIPWSKYPLYYQGIGYVLGSDAVTDLSIAMAFTREFRIDDVYLAFVHLKLRMRMYHLPEIANYQRECASLTRIATLPRIHEKNRINWSTGIVEEPVKH